VNCEKEIKKMNIKLNKILLTGLLIVPMVALLVSLFSPINVFAADCETGTYNIITGSACGSGTGQNGTLFGEGGLFTIIVNVALFIIGSISVLMLIYGGIRYTISGGDEKAITSAKNTILYAVVGIVVAVLAYAIVNFVISALMPGGATAYINIL
jgi:hypothetical protein